VVPKGGKSFYQDVQTMFGTSKFLKPQLLETGEPIKKSCCPLRNQEAVLTQLLSVFANQKSCCPLQISEIINKN
jgi:hypothetical protein